MNQPARHNTDSQVMAGFHDQPFAKHALCAETDPEAFYPDKGGSTREAKQVCNGNPDKGRAPCPVRNECLAWALDTDQRFGIWGGHSERERRKLKKQPAADGVVLAATGTDSPVASADTTEQPRSYGQTYIGGSDGHRPIPLATDVGARKAHTPKTPRPTGLDWSKHRAPEPEKPAEVIQLRCRWCRNPASDLVDDVCGTCRTDAEAQFHAPDIRPKEFQADVTPKPPTEDKPGQETRPAATSGLPAYALDIARVMATSEGHPDATVRTARKVVANALVALNKALRATDTKPTPAPAKPKRQPTQRSTRRVRSTPETEAIIRLYTGPENLSCPQIAERLDIGVKAVRATLDRAGIPRTDGRTTHSGGRNQVKAYPDQLVADIRRLYLEEQLSQAQVGEKLGVSTKVVQSVMAKHAIPARASAAAASQSGHGHPIKLDDTKVAEICRRYEAGESATALARAFDVSLPSILHRLRQNDITIRPRGGRRTDTKENQPA